MCLFNYGFLWVYAQECNCWIILNSIFIFLRKLHTVLHSGCPTGYKSDVPTMPSLGSVHLLEGLTELRKTYWISSLLYRVQSDAGTPRPGAGTGRAASLPPQTHRPQPPPARQPGHRGPVLWGFLWRLHCTGMIDSILGHW